MGDVPLNQHELLALAPLIDNKCFRENVEFLECKGQNPDPSACKEKGDCVTACVHAIHQSVKDREEYRKYTDCLEKNSFEYSANCSEERSNFLNFFYTRRT